MLRFPPSSSITSSIRAMALCISARPLSFCSDVVTITYSGGATSLTCYFIDV